MAQDNQTSASTIPAILQEKQIEVRRVAKVVKGGRVFRFSSLTVVGDGNGKGGFRSRQSPRGSCCYAEVFRSRKKKYDRSKN